MLLDTCALLWLVEGGGELKPKILEQIDLSTNVYISAISAFEISLKCQKGKLKLPTLPSEWFETVLDHHDLSILSLDLKVCLSANELPPIHQDPCDRFIIATAQLNNLPIVTSDVRFQKYDVKVIF